MSLYVCGDTHGDIDIAKLTSKKFPDGKNLTKDDYLLICGDCGLVWDGGKFDKYIQKWFNNKPWTTLFVDGNHENHDLIDSYPVEEWHGGKVHKISDSIIHLMRGQVFDIDGHICFTMGGAASIDKIWRKEGKSWWAREILSDEESKEAIRNLSEHDWHVEYVFTHCLPDNIQYCLGAWLEHDKVTNFLFVIEKDLEYSHWYSGHYHVDKDIGEKHTVLYQNIVKLW